MLLNEQAKNKTRMLDFIKNFFKYEAVGGALLAIATILALMVANSPYSELYTDFFQTQIVIKFGTFGLDKPLVLWINDGLMAIFFFMVGLELKREWLEGALSNPRRRTLPTISAIFGMIVPALFYIAFNYDDSIKAKGWAIPAATDIAFALGILSLFGKKVPIGLKVFLLSLAIIDDVGVILIIACFYTQKLSLISILYALLVVVGLWGLNARKINSTTPYVLLGVVLWYLVLKSGIHATIAGVILAFFIPMYDHVKNTSPLKKLEKDLHPPVAYFIMPLFAFANAGIPLAGTSDSLADPMSLGIICGLLFGKPLGVLTGYAVGTKLLKAEVPDGVNFPMLVGVGFLCGIGFTMSLFITMLAFQTSVELAVESRLAILLGSLMATCVGSPLIYWGIKRAQQQQSA